MRIHVLGQHVPGSIAVLAVIEGLGAFMALYAAVLIRFHTPLSRLHQLEARLGPLWPRALLFSAIVIICLLAFGLYSARQRAPLTGVVVRLAAALVIASAAIAAMFYILPVLNLWRGAAALAVMITGFALFTTRIVFGRAVDQDIFKHRVLVYGAGTSAAAIARLRRSTESRGFVLVGFVSPPGEERAVQMDRILESDADLAGLCERLGVTEVVVAMDDRRRGFPLPELLDCRLAGIDVTELLTFLERETGRVRIDVLKPSWMIFGQGFRRGPLRLFTLRCLDLFASVAVLLVCSPLMLLTVLAVKLEDGVRAPALYAQERVGLGGRTFRVLK